MLLEAEVLVVQLGYNALLFLELVIELVDLVLLENTQDTREIDEVAEVHKVDKLYVMVPSHRVTGVCLLMHGHVAR